MSDSHKKKSTKGGGKHGAADAGKASAGGINATAVIAAARLDAFQDQDPAKAFKHFRPLAEKVEKANLAPFTGQPLLMRANILTALSAIEAHLPSAVDALREPQLKEIFELPALVMGLDFAVGRVPVAKLSAGEIEKMLREGAPWRELMLTFLETVAHPLIGLVPRERVAAVRAGTGKLDQAQDFVAIPGLFTEFASALEGKHPFPADKLDLLATLGGTLVQQIRPGNVAVEVAKRSPESILRDQFAWLVEGRYDRLQVLGAVALGSRRSAELLPALRSTSAVVRAEAAAAAAEGAAASDAPASAPTDK